MKLRSEILNMPKTKVPIPTSVHTLKANSPVTPPMTTLFYQTLVSGLANQNETSQLRSMFLASDAVYFTSRGAVRPWKNTALGLGQCSMLGSKQDITMINRMGHTVSYDECKRLETEIAYTCSSSDHEMPAGLCLTPNLATGKNMGQLFYNLNRNIFFFFFLGGGVILSDLNTGKL